MKRDWRVGTRSSLIHGDSAIWSDSDVACKGKELRRLHAVLLGGFSLGKGKKASSMPTKVEKNAGSEIGDREVDE